MQNYPIGKEEEFILYMPSKVYLTENSKLITKQNEVNLEMSFTFSETMEHKVGKIIVKLQVKKATGVDKISCKILKLATTALRSLLTCLMFVNIENTK